MIGREIPITFLESPDIVFSLVPDQNWYLNVDQISPTLMIICTIILCLFRQPNANSVVFVIESTRMIFYIHQNILLE